MEARMSLITAQQQREAAAANTVAEVPPELVETMVIPEPVPVSLSEYSHLSDENTARILCDMKSLSSRVDLACSQVVEAFHKMTKQTQEATQTRSARITADYTEMMLQATSYLDYQVTSCVETAGNLASTLIQLNDALKKAEAIRDDVKSINQAMDTLEELMTALEVGAPNPAALAPPAR